MNRTQRRKGNRRDFLRRAPGVFAVLAGTAPLLRSAPASAQKAPKKAVAYQDQPKGDQKCANCQFYIEPDGGGAGTCQVVAGDVAPNAWCNLWAKAKG